MSLLDRRRVLLAKIETTPGVDASPTGAADAVETIGLRVIPYESESVSRGIDTANLGAEQEIITKRRAGFEFATQFAGAGGATTVPAFDSLLRGCGYAAGAVGASSVVYDLVSSFESLTIHAHKDGQRHPSTYCRGDLTAINIVTGQMPQFGFRFTGQYVTPTSVADPTPTLTAWQNAVRAGNDFTVTADLHGASVEMTSLEIAFNNTIVHRDVVGSESIEITNRAVSATIKFQAPAISVKDWFTAIDNETISTLQVVHGTAVGNIVTLDAPQVKLSSLDYEEEDGVVILSAGLTLLATAAGNDELTITTS